MFKYKGFTLLEILIAMMMIGILSAIALPKYQTYLTQSKVTSAFATLTAMKPQVEHLLSRHQNQEKMSLEALGVNEKETSNIGKFSLKQTSGSDHTLELQFLFEFEPIKNSTLSLVRAKGVWHCKTTLEDLYQPYSCNKKKVQHVEGS